MTIFLTTHYLEEADVLCGRVAIIDQGKIMASGSPAELKAKLGGDTLEVEVAEGQDLTDAIASMDDVRSVKKSGNRYAVRVPRVEDSLQAVTQGLTKIGAKVIDIRFQKSSLDQVFLEVTGRSIRDESSGSGSQWRAGR